MCAKNLPKVVTKQWTYWESNQQPLNFQSNAVALNYEATQQKALMQGFLGLSW